MRALVTLDYYYPHWTRLSAYAKRLAEGLVKRGHAVTVLTSMHNPDLARQEVVAAVHEAGLPAGAWQREDARLFGFEAEVVGE